MLYLVVFIRGSMVGLLGFLSCLGGNDKVFKLISFYYLLRVFLIF